MYIEGNDLSVEGERLVGCEENELLHQKWGVLLKQAGHCHLNSGVRRFGSGCGTGQRQKCLTMYC
jgi:hypothetical protein